MTAECGTVRQEDILCPGRAKEDEQKRDRPQREQNLRPGAQRSGPRYCLTDERRF